MKIVRKLEREQKRKEKEQQKKEKELLRKEMTEVKELAQERKMERGMKKTKTSVKKQSRRKKKTLEGEFDKLSLFKELNNESEAECPKCGHVYGEDDSIWICCDGCNVV